jgi:hypothetical protein
MLAELLTILRWNRRWDNVKRRKNLRSSQTRFFIYIYISRLLILICMLSMIACNNATTARACRSRLVQRRSLPLGHLYSSLTLAKYYPDALLLRTSPRLANSSEVKHLHRVVNVPPNVVQKWKLLPTGHND